MFLFNNNFYIKINCPDQWTGRHCFLIGIISNNTGPNQLMASRGTYADLDYRYA